MARRRVVTTTTTCDQCGAEIEGSGMWLGMSVDEVSPEHGTKLGLDFCSGECRALWREEHR